MCVCVCQLSQLQPLLAREQARLKREAAHEDADDVGDALRHLQFVCSPTQPQRRLFFL